MRSFDLEGESYLLDVAAGTSKGLKDKGYKVDGAVFLVRETAIKMAVSDPQTERHYTIVIKEVVKSETDTQIRT